MKKTKFHVLWEQTHVLLSPSLYSSHWQVNIVPLVDGIHALVHVIINNFTQVDLVSHVVAQGKEGLIVIITQQKCFFFLP
jgi:hypothetical protein